MSPFEVTQPALQQYLIFADVHGKAPGSGAVLRQGTSDDEGVTLQESGDRPLPRLSMDSHPLARIGAFETSFPVPLEALPQGPRIVELLRLDASAPLASSDELRSAVRDMLRVGGYKPTGRGKPASEYLLRTASGAPLRPINLAVDACNAVSLHSGIPISLVDLARAQPPFHIRAGRDDERYIFNEGGQEIDVAGLLCLCDAMGPCANAVKDAQRTKTSGATRRTLSVLWGTAGHEVQLTRAQAWYRELLGEAGAETRAVEA